MALNEDGLLPANKMRNEELGDFSGSVAPWTLILLSFTMAEKKAEYDALLLDMDGVVAHVGR